MRSIAFRAAAALPAAALLLGLVVAPVLAAPTTRYVDDDGLASAAKGCSGTNIAFEDVQSAVAVSAPGDTIIVCPGTYLGAFTVTVANLTIKSATKWAATIMPAANHTSDTALVWLNANKDKLSGFRLLVPTQNTCEYVSEMVLVRDAPNSTVQGNKIGITGNQGLGSCGYVVGIGVDGASGGSLVQGNRITDFQEYGIRDLSDGTVRMNKNKVNFNHAAYGYSAGPAGIYANPSSGGTSVIHGNTISDLSTAGSSTPRLDSGIYVAGGSVDVQNNVGTYVSTFITIDAATGGVMSGNTATLGIKTGTYVALTSGAAVAHNRFSATHLGIYVDKYSATNNIHDNNFSGPAATDCQDDSSGSGTAGTADTWANNTGDADIPNGLCHP